MSTYLLVHGSWHGAWCWYKISTRLRAADHTVVVPDMPGHGRDWTPPGKITMQDFVNTITQILDAAPEPVVLVVHSRNGSVASQAAEVRPDKIRKLVYLAAYLPPIGDSVSMAQGRIAGWSRDPDSLCGPQIDVNPEAGWDCCEVRHSARHCMQIARTKTSHSRMPCSRQSPAVRSLRPKHLSERHRRISGGSQEST